MDHASLAEAVRLPDQWSSIPGLAPDIEPLYRRVIASAPPGSLLVEVGCYLGRSLCLLGTLATEADRNLRVVGVDHCRGTDDPGDGTGLALARSLGGSFAVILARNVHACGLDDIVSLVVAPSLVAARLFADGACYFIFIDASHDESSVAADIAAWKGKVAPGGTLGGHDYADSLRFPGVALAVGSAFGDAAGPDPGASSCWSVKM